MPLSNSALWTDTNHIVRHGSAHKRRSVATKAGVREDRPDFGTKASMQNSKMYEPLPPALGGGTSAAAGDISNSLPAPAHAALPRGERLDGKLRRRALQLTSNAPVQKKPTKRARRPSVGKLVIPKAEQKYALYLPLAALWRSYAARTLAGAKPDTLGERVVRMDLHGAEIEVARSRDPSLVGVKGILVAETANTVLVATKKDRVLTLPKNVTVVRFDVGGKRVEVMLPALAFRASERSARKLKKSKISVLL